MDLFKEDDEISMNISDFIYLCEQGMCKNDTFFSDTLIGLHSLYKNTEKLS